MTIRTAMLCDECDSVFVTEQPIVRNGLVREAHAAGWTSTFNGGLWKNRCPEHEEDR